MVEEADRSRAIKILMKTKKTEKRRRRQMKRRSDAMILMKKAGSVSMKFFLRVMLVFAAAGGRLLAGILSCLGIFGILIGADMKEMAVFFLLAFALILTTELDERTR